MKKAFATIESWDLMFIIRHGYIPCLILMMFGVIFTAVWSNHLQKTLGSPIYNRGIYVNLSGVNLSGILREHMQLQSFSDSDDSEDVEASLLSENKSTSLEKERMIEYELFNVPNVLGVTLQDEREAYSNLMNSEMSGPLKVTHFSFRGSGFLKFRVGVALEADDQRIVAFIDRLNHVRNLIIPKLEKKLSLLKKRAALLNAAMTQLQKKDSKGNHKDLISVLRGEKEFVGLLATEIQNRLPAIRIPIKVPTLQKMLPANTHIKSVIACALATLICSILTGFISGLASLMRKQAVQDANRAAVLHP